MSYTQWLILIVTLYIIGIILQPEIKKVFKYKSDPIRHIKQVCQDGQWCIIENDKSDQCHICNNIRQCLICHDVMEDKNNDQVFTCKNHTGISKDPNQFSFHYVDNNFSNDENAYFKSLNIVIKDYKTYIYGLNDNIFQPLIIEHSDDQLPLTPYNIKNQVCLLRPLYINNKSLQKKILKISRYE